MRRLLIAGMLALAAAPALADGITVEEAWMRPAARGQNGAVYFTLKSAGEGDRLVAAASAAAERAELHSHAHEGGIARMQPVQAVPIPAGESVSFAPSGLHVMLVRLRRSLSAGERVSVELTFERAGRRTIEVVVGQRATANHGVRPHHPSPQPR